MTTREKLTPEAVGAMSDEELSVAVARDVLGCRPISEARHRLAPGEYRRRSPWGVIIGAPRGGILLEPSNPVAVDHVREHMRERWARSEPGPSWNWQIESSSREWTVAVREFSAPMCTRVVCRSRNAVYGRAIFEAALLSAQEMEG